MYRPTVPSRIPRNVPDGEFNEIFAALGSHRDRALVAFYVSTGVRTSELLSVTQGGVDPARQLITVVRKGSRALQQVPPSADAFVWLRRNLTTDEDRAFWAWAAIEVLRATRVRAEELVQLSHHSLVQHHTPAVVRADRLAGVDRDDDSALSAIRTVVMRF